MKSSLTQNIRNSNTYSVRSIKERWFKQNLKVQLETPVRAKRRVRDTLQIIEQTYFDHDSLLEPRLN